MSGKLEGQIAVVTGGGRGIGRSIAQGLSNEGATLVLVSRTQSQLEAAASAIRESGGDVSHISADVTDKAAVSEIADRLRADFGRVDILVNNAGGGIEPKTVAESDPDLWIQDVNVNLISAYLVTHALLPLMKDNGGKIINVGSGMGHSSGGGSSAYHVGKAGMWMFTRCLADEVWEDGITVNELIPGPVATDLTAGRMEVGGPPPFAPSEYVKGPDDVVPLAMWLSTQPAHGPTAQSFGLTRRAI